MGVLVLLSVAVFDSGCAEAAYITFVVGFTAALA